MTKKTSDFPTMQGPVCPLPLPHDKTIVMGHGSGGKMTFDLIRRYFYPTFENEILLQGDDAAVLDLGENGKLAFSTDSHMVSPLFFPGGDIGRLAVAGTVNDLAMVGAQPAWLTAAFIMEEGFDMHQLADVLTSMSQTAAEAGIRIVAGDTKVAEKGKADGLFINTTGLGLIPAGRRVSGANAQVGDAVLVSGTMGDHGIAVLAARGGLDFEAQVVSDVAPVNGVVEALFGAGIDVHVLRDPTRGGLATTLNEIAKQSQVGIVLEEGTIPVRGPVAAACEMLGFDPLYVANEGKLTAIVPQEQAEAALEAMRATRYGKDAACIGTVEEAPEGRVLMKTAIGGTRMVDVLAGEILPRIC